MFLKKVLTSQCPLNYTKHPIPVKVIDLIIDNNDYLLSHFKNLLLTPISTRQLDSSISCIPQDFSGPIRSEEPHY